MSEEIVPIKRELPILSDLYKSDDIATLFKTDQFNLLMNQAPEPKWILENKFAGNSKYIPIGILETLLQRIFKEFRVEVMREGTMFNSVYVTIRLHYLHPISGQWGFHDGVGSAQIQTKSGASPADLANINNNAVMMALPMAKSYAIKDACDHFGKLFGRDLNRKDTMGFGVDKNLDKESEYNDLVILFEQKQDFIPANDFDDVKNVIEKKQVKAYPRIKTYLEKIQITENNE
jgi:hypothetical protein